VIYVKKEKTKKVQEAGFEPAIFPKTKFWAYRPEQRRRGGLGVRRPAQGHGSPRLTLSRLFLAYYRVSGRFWFFEDLACSMAALGRL